MIYFARPVSGGAIEIGTTTDLVSRLHQLEDRSGHPIACLGTMNGGPEEVLGVQARFGHLRIEGTEHFRPDAELMAFIGRPLLVHSNPRAAEGHQMTTEKSC